jgi:hypothetical protein
MQVTWPTPVRAQMIQKYPRNIQCVVAIVGVSDRFSAKGLANNGRQLPAASLALATRLFISFACGQEAGRT